LHYYKNYQLKGTILPRMLTTRIIPCLLLQNSSLVKTVKFKKPGYLGDPINTVRIFNELEVDELIFLDISAARGLGWAPKTDIQTGLQNAVAYIKSEMAKGNVG